LPVWSLNATPGSAWSIDCVRSGDFAELKAEAPIDWTLDGILSWSTTPGWEAGAVLSAGAIAEDLAPLAVAGRGRGGGATGVVAMTWISGRLVVLEALLAPEASCATPGLGASAKAMRIAQTQHVGRCVSTPTPRSIAPVQRIAKPAPYSGTNTATLSARTVREGFANGTGKSGNRRTDAACPAIF
jgi:hypothetical protein